MAWSWNEVSFKLPSNPKLSVILWSGLGNMLDYYPSNSQIHLGLGKPGCPPVALPSHLLIEQSQACPA